MSADSSKPNGTIDGIGRRRFLKNSAFFIAGTTVSASFLAAC